DPLRPPGGPRGRRPGDAGSGEGRAGAGLRRPARRASGDGRGADRPLPGTDRLLQGAGPRRVRRWPAEEPDRQDPEEGAARRRPAGVGLSDRERVTSPAASDLRDRQVASRDTAPRPPGGVLEVLAAATRLGLTSFGGPVAHLGYFRDE